MSDSNHKNFVCMHFRGNSNNHGQQCTISLGIYTESQHNPPISLLTASSFCPMISLPYALFLQLLPSFVLPLFSVLYVLSVPSLFGSSVSVHPSVPLSSVSLCPSASQPHSPSSANTIPLPSQFLSHCSPFVDIITIPSLPLHLVTVAAVLLLIPSLLFLSCSVGKKATRSANELQHVPGVREHCKCAMIRATILTICAVLIL
jgi:hypothetical protein